jgi:hypothetical protein
MSGLRLALVAVLVISTGLFATGVIAERSQTGEPAQPSAGHARDSGESAAESQSGESAGDSEGGESGAESPGADANGSEPAGAGGGGGGEPSVADHDKRETVLGVDIESTPLIILAVIAGLALALLAASPPGRRSAVLLTIAGLMIAWAALDVRELVHQVDESRTGLALLASAVAVLHLAAAAIAARLAAREHAGVGSPGRPGTMPA